MKRLITPVAIEHLSINELRSLFQQVWRELSRSEQGSPERRLALASLENIERVICCKLAGPRL